MLRKFYNKILTGFNQSEYSTKQPTITPLLLLSTLGLLVTNKQIFANPFSFIFQSNDTVYLDNQKTIKKTILFDYNNFLYCNYFDVSKFDIINIKRAHVEEFLFYLSHYYELICVTDNLPLISDRDLKRLDPLSCISYKIFTDNKKNITTNNLNRQLKNTAVISVHNDEFNKDFKDNILILPKFNTRKTESGLLDLVHFFTNLHFMNVEDIRPVLKSYKNCDFQTTFRKVQERLFKQRNLFSFNTFEQKLNEINIKKAKDYVNIKEKIQTQYDYTDIKDWMLKFVKTVIF